jgi:mitochondrial fission protein ELM1
VGAAIAPHVWLLVGDRAGDNRQAEAVAGSLPWSTRRRYLRVREEVATRKLRVKASIDHLDLDRSDRLEPPWPDLVITMGRRLGMAALWIREHSDRRAKIVLLGKPSGKLDDFDLIVTSAENPLPRRPNVMAVDLPLLRCDEEQLSDAARLWASPIRDLRRPVIALMVGGPTKPFVFGREDAAEMIRRVAQTAVETGAGLFVTTSPRTPIEFYDVLREGLPPGAIFHPFAADPEKNPYLGLLALADRFVVTGDSISMLVELARLGRPLAIYPLPIGSPRPWTRLARRFAGRTLSSTADERSIGWLEPLGYALFRAGILRHARNFRAIHRVLVREGLAVHFGGAFPTDGRVARDELPRVTARIEEMMQPT